MQKKLKLLIPCIIASLLLTSCSKQYSTSNTYIPYQDYQYTYNNQGSLSTMAESEDGYYFLCGYYLYYADKTTMSPVILCNKPNCLHSDETDPEKITSCNACFTSFNGTVSYFDGAIYVLEYDNSDETGNSYQLVKLSKDGTKRKIVLHFTSAPTSLAIHRGKVYVAGRLFDANGTSIYGVSEYDLSKSASQNPITIFEGELTGGNIQDLICYGQNVYFTEFARNSEITAIRIQHYNLDTKTNTCIAQEKGYSFPGALTFINDHILYSYTTLDDLTGEIIQRYNYISNLDGTNIKESFMTDIYQLTYSDGKYVYLDDIKWSPFSKPKSEWSLIVADSEGNAIASTPTADYSIMFSSLICGSDTHLFMKNQTDTTYQILYADKAEFEAGTIDFHLMFEIDLDKMTPAFVINSD